MSELIPHEINVLKGAAEKADAIGSNRLGDWLRNLLKEIQDEAEKITHEAAAEIHGSAAQANGAATAVSAAKPADVGSSPANDTTG